MTSEGDLAGRTRVGTGACHRVPNLSRREVRKAPEPVFAAPGYLVCAALALTVLEGGFRKWIVGSETGAWSYAAYFSKDLVFAAVLFLPAMTGRIVGSGVFRVWLVRGSVLWVFGAGLSAISGVNFVGAVLTTRAALVLPWVACLALPRLRGLQLERVAAVVGGLTVLNCVLAMVQNQLPPGHELNRYAAEEGAVVALDSGVRATGTFSYITGLGVLSSVGVWAGLVLMGEAGGNWKKQAAAAGVIAAGFGCAAASISRGPALVAAVMVSAWAALAVWRRWVRWEALAAVGAAGVVLLWSTGWLGVIGALGRAVVERHETAGDSIEERGFGQLAETRVALRAFPLGKGLGQEQVAGTYAASGLAGFNTFETQFPRLVLETGAAGVAGFLFLCWGAIVALQRAKHAAFEPRRKAALLATQLLVVPLFYGNTVFNHVTSAFVWLVFAAALAAGNPAAQPAAAAMPLPPAAPARRLAILPTR